MLMLLMLMLLMLVLMILDRQISPECVQPIWSPLAIRGSDVVEKEVRPIDDALRLRGLRREEFILSSTWLEKGPKFWVNYNDLIPTSLEIIG